MELGDWVGKETLDKQKSASLNITGFGSFFDWMLVANVREGKEKEC